MKIVLDTNVFISGIFFGGPPSQILKLWRKSKIRILLTEEILGEYQRVGEELSARYPSINISSIIELFTIFGEFVETKGISESVCEDPDDNKFIECAIASQCKLIVSGDKSIGDRPRFFGIFYSDILSSASCQKSRGVKSAVDFCCKMRLNKLKLQT